MKSNLKPEFEVVEGTDARQVPVRLLVVQEEARPAVELQDEPVVMTFPHLFVRELIALVAASLFIVVISLLFDAPLEELANPQKTPNQAKAPWYFLGLQELLHYYPPVISGVVLPGLVVTALAVIPYFNVNVQRTPFWATHKPQKIVGVLVATGVVTLIFYITGAHPIWPLIGPTWLIGLCMLLPVLVRADLRVLRWVETRSLAFWIFTWFLVAAVVMSVIGVFFRGPAWSFTLPWVDGIY